MTTLATMESNRASAGATYLAALAALRAAYVDLAAYDFALMNRDYGAKHPQDIQTFSGECEQVIPHGLIHPTYAPPDSVAGAWGAAAETQAAIYLADLIAG